MTCSNISGIRSSRPKAKAAARQCTGAFSMISQVVAVNATAARGASAAFSASGTGVPARSSSRKSPTGFGSAPACRMPSTYSSKWLV